MVCCSFLQYSPLTFGLTPYPLPLKHWFIKCFYDAFIANIYVIHGHRALHWAPCSPPPLLLGLLCNIHWIIENIFTKCFWQIYATRVDLEIFGTLHIYICLWRIFNMYLSIKLIKIIFYSWNALMKFPRNMVRNRRFFGRIINVPKYSSFKDEEYTHIFLKWGIYYIYYHSAIEESDQILPNYHSTDPEAS